MQFRGAGRPKCEILAAGQMLSALLPELGLCSMIRHFVFVPIPDSRAAANTDFAVGRELPRARQIRACGFPAHGSHLGYRRRYVAVYEPTPVSRLSGTKSSACLVGPHSPFGPCPSLHQLRRGSLRFVRRLRSYYGRVRLLESYSVHHRLRLLTFPMRAVSRYAVPVRPEISQLPIRSFCT